MLGGRETSLSVARSLGRRGIAVHALLDGASSLVTRSRHVVGSFAGDGDAEGRWPEWFERGPKGAVVFPCGDLGLEFMARRRDWLQDLGYRPIEANDDLTLAMLDKERGYELARKAGVDVPRTMVVKTSVDVELVANAFSYPCALKPRDSYRFRNTFGKKALVVHSTEQLLDAFEEILPSGFEMIVTEIVTGPERERFEYCSYYSYITEEGETLFRFTKRKPREYPLVFGGGTYHVTKWDPEVAAVGERLFTSVGLRGIGNVEFKRDRNGRYVMIECNLRVTAADALVRIAGLDIPHLAYRRALGEPVDPLAGFRDDLSMWYPYGDFLAFRDARRLDQLTTLGWLRSLAHPQHFPFFDWRDPVPTMANTRSAIRRITARRRSPRSPQR